MKSIKAREMPLRDRPLSELLRITGKQWAEHEAAYTALKEAKTTTLERLKTALIEEEKMAEAKAERLAKCTPEWGEYLDLMAEENKLRLDLKIEVDCIFMMNSERIDKNANARKEIYSYNA